MNRDLPNLDAANLVEQVREAMKDAVRGLEPVSFELIEAPDPAPFGDRIFTLRSNHQGTAPVSVMVSNSSDLLTVTIGEGILLELPTSGSWRPLGLPTVLDEIREVCRAAIRGDVREEIWKDEGVLVKAVGFLHIENREVLASERHMGGGSIRRAEQKTLTYDSYETGGESGRE